MHKTKKKMSTHISYLQIITDNCKASIIVQ